MGDKPPACTCGYVSCVCGIRVKHERGCRYRTAAECPVELACEHGFQACPICDPCTCGANVKLVGVT